MPSMSSATWRTGCAAASTLGTRRSRSRAATRAARSITVAVSTTTRTSTRSAHRSGGQRLLALQNPPRESDSRRVSRIHPAIPEAARTERARLRVRSVRGVDGDAVVEPVRVARVLVVDGVGDHHVADLGVKGRRLAQDVDARDPRAVLCDLAKDVVRGQTERIVDVDNAGFRCAQLALVHRADPWIDRCRVKLRDLEHLRGRVDAGTARRYVADAVGGLHLGAPAAQAAALGVEVEELPCPVVEQVVSRGAAVAGLELAPLIIKLRVVSTYEVENVILELPRHAGQDVDQAVRVRGDEIDRRFANAHLLHRRCDRLPPPAGIARVAEVAAPDQPD